MAPGLELVGRLPDLVRSEHEALILDRSRLEQVQPVLLPRAIAVNEVSRCPLKKMKTKTKKSGT